MSRTCSTTAAITIGAATRSSGTPAASTALSSLNRVMRISVNAAATTGMIPLRCTKM